MAGDMSAIRTDSSRGEPGTTAVTQRNRRADDRYDLGENPAGFTRLRLNRATAIALPINRLDEPQRFLGRQKRLLHLVHDVRKCDFVLWIGKCVAAPGAGMSEGSS